jgi:D-3-phosphoglycerate dehydrogenase / 2-oxoglutarate reductase
MDQTCCKVSHVRPADELVIVSERLGPLTEAETAIERAGARVRGAPLWSVNDIARHAADATVVILGSVEWIGVAELAAMPRCHGLVRRGVGYDNIDVAAATRRGIVVANVPDASVEEVSDHTLSLLLAVERRVCELDSAVRHGEWERDSDAVQILRRGIRQLGELTLGIVGLGRIGQALARKAKGLYGRIVATDPYVSRDLATAAGVDLVDLPELLAGADHISLHAPMSSDNRHLIGSDQIAAMRPDSVLVNTARGGLVDEIALLAAIRSGAVAGAGLDTTEREPLPRNDPMLRSGRIVLTAHSAAWSRTAEAALADRSNAAAVQLVRGELPESVVNPAVVESDDLRNEALRRRQPSVLAARRGGTCDD